MSKRIAVLIAASCVGVASWVWFQQPEAPSRSIAPAKATRAASTGEKSAPASDQARVFSAKSPVLQSGQLAEPEIVAEVSTTSRRWATVNTAPSEEAAAVRRAPAAPSSKRLSSAKPGDEDARLQLVRDIQYELKRAGCYDGEVHGHWNNSTKSAMKAFTDRVNAALPIEEPDYILLTLTQGQTRPACKGEPPRSTIAQQPRGQGQNKATASAPAAITPQATTTPAPQATTDADQSQLARDPLPGRMAVGAPLAGTSERQEVVLEEARRRDQVALETWRAQDRSSLGADDRAGALPDSVVGPPPTLADAHNQPRKPRAAMRLVPRNNAAQRGSTRQVFSGLLRSAP